MLSVAGLNPLNIVTALDHVAPGYMFMLILVWCSRLLLRIRAITNSRSMSETAVALLATQAERALDDLGEMFVRRMQHIHTAAKLVLDPYRAATVERTDGLVTTRMNCSSPITGKARSMSASRRWTR